MIEYFVILVLLFCLCGILFMGTGKLDAKMGYQTEFKSLCALFGGLTLGLGVMLITAGCYLFSRIVVWALTGRW